MTGLRELKVTDSFLDCMCESNWDSTKNLSLSGKYLFTRFGRRIKDHDLPRILGYLSRNRKIVCVELCYNDISDVGMSDLVYFLEENRSLKYLDLMLNNIGPEGIKKLSGLGKKLTLQSLRLNGNKIGPEGGIFLSELLMVNETLVNLDLGETDQTIKSFAYLTTALKENTTLKHINLSRPIGPQFYFFDVEHCAQLIGQMIRVNYKITELHLEKVGFNENSIEILVDGLKENKSVKMLNLGCNDIGNVGAVYLGELLKVDPPLEALILNHNKIGDTGAWSISYGFSFSKIKFLDVANNQLSDTGIINLLCVVTKPLNLLVLFLWGNKITERTMAVLEILLDANVLKQTSLDTKVYRDQFNELKIAYNSQADLYKQRYYSIVPKLKRKRDDPPLKPGDLSFEHHNLVRSWEIDNFLELKSPPTSPHE